MSNFQTSADAGLGAFGRVGPSAGLDLVTPADDPWQENARNKAVTSWRVLDDAEALTSEFIARAMPGFRQLEEDYLFALRSYRGLIEIAQIGCGAATFLIVTGPQAGRVVDEWILAAHTPDGAAGVFGPPGGGRSGQLPTFLEWIDHWIERSIKELPKERELRRKMREILSTHQEQVRRRKPP